MYSGCETSNFFFVMSLATEKYDAIDTSATLHFVLSIAGGFSIEFLQLLLYRRKLNAASGESMEMNRYSSVFRLFWYSSNVFSRYYFVLDIIFMYCKT